MVMVDPALKDQLLEDLERLPPEHQRRVAEYAHALVGKSRELPPGARVSDLKHLFGILDPESAREMREAIEEGCEQVDLSEW